MSWIDKLLPPRINKTSDSGARRVPEGLWVKCPSCESVLYSEDLAANLHVCPKCDHHMRIGARARIDSLLDMEGRDDADDLALRARRDPVLLKELEG